MNTRLQVEHPITEMITGLDLVELQLRVAAGERLPSSLTGAGPGLARGAGPVPIIGHAFEARVYAEDPLRGFLPSTGVLSRYIEPPSFGAADPFVGGSTIRCDSGITQGSEISMHYDPMICKLVTHGPDRATALDSLRAALDDYVIRGVGHNIGFLRDLTDHPRFVAGALSTAFIPEEYPTGFHGVSLTPAQTHSLVASGAFMAGVRSWHAAGLSGGVNFAPDPETSDVVVSIGASKAVEGANGVVVTTPVDYRVEIAEDAGSDPDSPHLHFTITPLAGGAPTKLRLANPRWSPDAPLFLADLPDTSPTAPPSAATLRVQVLSTLPDGYVLGMVGSSTEVRVRSHLAHGLMRHMRPHVVADVSKLLRSPMPATLLQLIVRGERGGRGGDSSVLPFSLSLTPSPLQVAPGDSVEEGQECAVIESMKMQQILRAPKKYAWANLYRCAPVSFVVR